MKNAPSDAAGWYYGTVADSVDDIPWRERQRILDTLADRLGALGPDDSPTSELGPPEDYAAQVRAAAGATTERGGSFARLRASRTRTKVLLGAAAFLVVVLVAGAVSALRYQPLRAEGTAEAVDPGLVVQDAGGVQGLTVRFQPGGQILVRYSLTNSGLVDVNIDGIDIEKRFPVKVKELRIVREETATTVDFDSATPVDDFAVKPDEEVVLYAVLEMINPPTPPCDGCKVTYEVPDLATDTLGVNHDVDEPGHSVSIQFPEAQVPATGSPPASPSPPPNN